MVFGKKKRKKETLERCGAWLDDIILKELVEGKFDDRTFPTTLQRSYSNLVDGISSLGYSREEVEKEITKMQHRGLVEVWNISGSYAIIEIAGEMPKTIDV